MEKTWNGFENPNVMRKIPEHVRYAFCRAQNNSAEDCLNLVIENQPLTGLAEPEMRYEKYMQNERTKHNVEEDQENDELLKDPEDVEKAIREVLEDVGVKEPQDERLLLMQRIAVEQQKKKKVTPKPPPTASANPVSQAPKTLAPTASAKPPSQAPNPLAPKTPSKIPGSTTTSTKTSQVSQTAQTAVAQAKTLSKTPNKK